MNTAPTTSKLNWLSSISQTVKQNVQDWIRNEIVDDDPYDQMLQDLADQEFEAALSYQDDNVKAA